MNAKLIADIDDAAHKFAWSRTNADNKLKSIIEHSLPDVYYYNNNTIQRPGTDFHFIDKSITVDSAASEKDVRFYWDGLLTDLSILSFSGFPSTSYITLPTELKDDFIYTLKVKFD